jgi:hypothetical protein
VFCAKGGVVCATCATGEVGLTGWVATGWAAGAAAVLLGPGEITRTASAMSESGPAARCAATTPNAASPNVIKAAKTITTTRIAPSAVLLLSLLKVKAQLGAKSMKTAANQLIDLICGFYDRCAGNSLF